AVQMPQDPAWIIERPDFSYAVRETVDALAQAFRSVRRQFPDSAPARLNHISAKDGGYLRPHRSHQSGRDADIGLFYKGDRFPPRGALRERLIDSARNWALLRALITETDVQLILVDRSIQTVLHRFALSIGEDAAWLSQVFGQMVKHARSHRDHFHVRFYAPRSQELGRRLQPMLALLPGQNLTTYVVLAGNTLGRIAARYKTSVAAIRRANQMKRESLLRLGQHLIIPLRGACTICPLPPPLAIPPRLLPPEVVVTDPQPCRHGEEQIAPQRQRDVGPADQRELWSQADQAGCASRVETEVGLAAAGYADVVEAQAAPADVRGALGTGRRRLGRGHRARGVRGGSGNALYASTVRADLPGAAVRVFGAGSGSRRLVRDQRRGERHRKSELTGHSPLSFGRGIAPAGHP